MQRKHAFHDPEAQDGEEDGGGREYEAGRPQRLAVAREAAPGLSSSQQHDRIAADAASVA